jgi:hypothetical protein
MKETTKTVIWLKPHPYFSYNAGHISEVKESHYEMLITDEFVRPITAAEIQHIEELKKPAPPVDPKDYVKVKFIKCHNDFSYNAGDIGSVTPANFLMLNQGGYIEVIEDNDISSVWKRLKGKIKK